MLAAGMVTYTDETVNSGSARSIRIRVHVLRARPGPKTKAKR